MTEIRLYNTKTRALQALEPTVQPGRVGMYVCGPTVYDRAHLGNARPVLVFDVLFRLLRHVYGPQNVTYVRNFTDVDDKIIARAAETGKPIGQITEETTRWYLEDMAALGALEPTEMPRATAYIPEMVAMIDRLIARGHAYAAEGHVLFDVRSYAEYGRLSGRSVDDMIAGARVEVAPYKRDPMDFVLWKPSDADQPGWDSPWGRGRPGWHIECSAMSLSLLGESFDIHGGGNDLMFPHHENEIAQSRCAHPEGAFARIWMHNEMVLVNGEKMSKSLGNFITVHDLRRTMLGREGFVSRDVWIKTRSAGERVFARPLLGPVIRLALLMTHYRDRLDWNFERVREADRVYHKLRSSLHGSDIDYRTYGEKIPKGLIAALREDLNTPEAIRILVELSKGARNGEGDSAAQLLAGMEFLGLIDKVGSKQIVLRRAITSLANTVSDLEGLGIDPESVWSFIRESARTDPHSTLGRVIDSRFFQAGARTAPIGASGSNRGHVFMSARDRSEALKNITEEEIETLLAMRDRAKKNKDFKAADQIRDKLAAKKIEVVDTPEGPRWRYKG